MKFWFLRFLSPWWGTAAPARVRLGDILNTTVEAQAITRSVVALTQTREVVAWGTVTRTVEEVI